MNPRNRDLLVFTKKEIKNSADLQHQIELLNNLFHMVETSDAACVANEVIDLNRYKIITRQRRVRAIMRAQQPKPFVFISNKN